MFLVFYSTVSNTRYDIIKGHSPTVGYPVGSIARMEKEDVTQLVRVPFDIEALANRLYI